MDGSLCQLSTDAPLHAPTAAPIGHINAGGEHDLHWLASLPTQLAHESGHGMHTAVPSSLTLHDWNRYSSNAHVSLHEALAGGALGDADGDGDGDGD